MSDLEAAKLQVGLFDRRNEERMLDGEFQYSEPSHIAFARALIEVAADRDRLLDFARDIATNYDHEGRDDCYRSCRVCRAEFVMRQLQSTTTGG